MTRCEDALSLLDAYLKALEACCVSHERLLTAPSATFLEARMKRKMPVHVFSLPGGSTGSMSKSTDVEGKSELRRTNEGRTNGG